MRFNGFLQEPSQTRVTWAFGPDFGDKLLEDGDVDGEAAGWGRKLGIAIGVGGALVGVGDVVAVPCDGAKFLVGPFGLNAGAAPLVAEVVEDVDEAGLIDIVRLEADALHDVEVGIGVKDLRISAGVVVM